jgi:hypothetical protein
MADLHLRTISLASTMVLSHVQHTVEWGEWCNCA